MSVEILYTAWNRREFVDLSWHLLMANTDWDLVGKVTVYDDGSEDGTLELLRERIDQCPVEVELRETDLRSPPAIMNHFFAEKRDEFVAKIDSDICCPPGWLPALLGVMERQPKLELLGAEVGQTRPPREGGGETYEFTGCSHIGGVGLMRTAAFTSPRRPQIPSRGRFGFTEWQERYRLARAWITPDLPMPQIDRVPREPWMGYSLTYIKRGWQRNWGHYPKDGTADWFWDWMVECR